MLIVDTFNVLHAIEGLGPEAADLTVASLGQTIARSRFVGIACILVCDGNSGTSGLIEGAPSVQTRYVGAGRDADSEIERMIASNTAPKRLLVVSSDHRIRRAALKRKSKWLDSRTFLAQILRDSEKSAGPSPVLSADDEREIMLAFGVEPEEIHDRRRAKRSEGTGDETLDEAVRHFGDRLSPEDLDMSRWIRSQEKGDGRSS